MNSYEQSLGVLVDLIEGNEVEDQDEVDALNCAADAMGFVLSIHNAFVAQGVTMPPEPDCYRLENLFDAYVCELAAATMALQNYPDSTERLRTAANELQVVVDSEQCNVDPQTIQGYRKLADRIEASRIAFIPLMEQYDKDNKEKS